MSDIAEFDLSPRPIGHLPIIAVFARRLGIVSTIAAILPMDRRMKVSDAECVLLMILNILQGRCGLYHMGPWAEGTDSEILIGEGIDPLRFSDARIAHTLDRIWNYGPDNVLSAVVTDYLRQDDAPSEYCVHQDTTTLKLYGEYDRGYKPQEPTPGWGFSKGTRSAGTRRGGSREPRGRAQGAVGGKNPGVVADHWAVLAAGAGRGAPGASPWRRRRQEPGCGGGPPGTSCRGGVG